MSRKKGMKHYSIDFRKMIVNEYNSSKRTISEITRYYSINESQIRNWILWTEQYEVPKQMTGKKKGRPKGIPKDESKDEKILRLEMENTLLKKYHELLLEESKKK